jgi:hypothetical protein
MEVATFMDVSVNESITLMVNPASWKHPVLRLLCDSGRRLPYLLPLDQRSWEGTSSQYSATIIGYGIGLKKTHGKRTSV